MTMRSDSALSGPQGQVAPTAEGQASQGSGAPAGMPMPSQNVAHNTHVYHQNNLTQTVNQPLPGTYQPAHPAQNGG